MCLCMELTDWWRQKLTHQDARILLIDWLIDSLVCFFVVRLCSLSFWLWIFEVVVFFSCSLFILICNQFSSSSFSLKLTLVLLFILRRFLWFFCFTSLNSVFNPGISFFDYLFILRWERVSWDHRIPFFFWTRNISCAHLSCLRLSTKSLIHQEVCLCWKRNDLRSTCEWPYRNAISFSRLASRFNS